MKRAPGILILTLLVCREAYGLGQERYVETRANRGNFVVASHKQVTRIYVDAGDYPGVVRAVQDLRADIERVTNGSAEIVHETEKHGRTLILIGTIGKNGVIDELVRTGKLDGGGLAGKWESFVIQTVANPLPGLSSALVIAGSDKRGTIYGIYDLSEQIGVSPWYWWADVPVHHQDTLTIRPGTYRQGPPAVKYRGIFLNDEAPSLTGWVKEKYGTYNQEFYRKVFELILRLKGNYLWPAMWNNAFNEDDPENPKLADEYGIVMGTSHHEPMMRAQQEWKRHGSGPWDYSKNAAVLEQFWREGAERNQHYENMTTIGMRGDGDLPMSESANIALLERIVAEQRKIIADVYHRDAATVPQDWALYKEVLEYYDKGMRVPDDVTLLWCDDNWGNIRRLPAPEERKRSGGAGIYYHFDYVGDPRSYKWINTNPLPKIWEQMNLALNYGADRIWIVNVGDLKPMEFPIEFFLSLAWDPQRWPKEKIGEFTTMWASREFGPEHAPEIAEILEKYAKYNARRKPELLTPDTYSQLDYREAETVAADFAAVTAKAEEIYKKLPEDEKSAFYELVLYPTKASAVVNQLYITAAKNRLYAVQGRASTNELANQARRLFQLDAKLSAYYNHTLAAGKWDHMMDQTHIGYTGWNEPPTNSMPAVREIPAPDAANMGIAVEGSADAWPGATASALLEFDRFGQQQRYIDIFNRGKAPFTFKVATRAPWIVVSEIHGKVEQEKRVTLSIDWRRASDGDGKGLIEISSDAGQHVTVQIKARKTSLPSALQWSGFVEGDGYISMEATHYTRKVDGDVARWEPIDDLGKTLSAMSVFPVTAPSVVDGRAACLEYDVYLFDKGHVTVEAAFDPTLNFVPGRGLRYSVSFEHEAAQTVDLLADQSKEAWETSVKDSVRVVKSAHMIANPGYHTLRVCMVDPGVVLQKLVVDLGGLRPSYLGPPESHRIVRPSN